MSECKIRSKTLSALLELTRREEQVFHRLLGLFFAYHNGVLAAWEVGLFQD
jgi:hypothetical protein